MIAKYHGRCTFCGKPIVVGVDQYDVERKESFHNDCKFGEESNPGPDAFRLANELGFIGPDVPMPYAEWHLWRSQPVNGKLF